MSIRLRFTLLYTIILAVTLAFLGSTVYAIQARSTMNRGRQTLVTFARRMVEARRFTLGSGRRLPQARPTPEAGLSPLPGPDFGGVREPFRDQELYFELRGEDGAIIQRSVNLNDQTLPLTEAGKRALQAGQPWMETVSIRGERVLMYSEPIRLASGGVEIVQVARSLADVSATLTLLRSILFIAISIVVLAAFGIGWFFAGLMLRPIARITATAQTIGVEQDFGRRVEHRGPNDELGRLVTTFNTMLSQLQGAYRRIEQALQMQRRFVADVSHELRTPLTTIRGNIELLRRFPPIDADDQLAVVTDIAGETDRLIRLVNDLLMLEHSDAGQRLRSEAVRIKPLVEEACHQVAVLDPGREIACAEVDDVAVFGDRDALRQVLLILLDNAIKHASGDIRVATTQDAGQVAIRIRDSGPGIPPDMLPLIFERFQRGDDARVKPGTGLGLSIAKALIEAQKGTIEVESQVGQGSVFTVRMPQAEMSKL